MDQLSCADPGQPCASISYAYSQLDPGDTISISSGPHKPTSHNASLVIDKDITLQGAGSGLTWIKRALDDPTHRIIEIDGNPGGHQVPIVDLRISLGIAEGTTSEGFGGACSMQMLQAT